MPIVDGLTSTKMIRSFEKSHPAEMLSARAAINGRVPIFAVSASLIERERQKYIDAGFDGWILKPVDFKRLTILLSGIVKTDVRETCIYKPGEWEHGGWFKSCQPDIFAAATKPSAAAPVSASPKIRSMPDHGEDPFDDQISKEQARLDTPATETSDSKANSEQPPQE